VVQADLRKLSDVSPGSGVRYSVRSVERTVQLLNALADGRGRPKTLTDLAQRAGMPESSALRYLATLSQLGLVERAGAGLQGRYQLGIGLFRLAEHAVGKPDIRVIALPFLRRLLDRYRETVNLAVFRQHRLVILDALEGLSTIRHAARVGDGDRLRSTALGKAVLATFPDEEAIEFLREENLPACTPNTIMSDGDMRAEFKLIRKRGYAIDDEESEIGLRCVGVSVLGTRGNVYGLSISGPSHLFTVSLAHEAGPVLVAAREEIERKLDPRRTLSSRRSRKATG
jgi:IclR family transcriptional regulator, acetate operon repressor